MAVAAGEKPTLRRWLNAARYAVAAVVFVLVVVVIVHAIKVVLRPDTLRLSVVGGSVSSTPSPASGNVSLGLTLRAENPSGRVRMYLLDITLYLFDNTTPASTPTPEDDSIVFFRPPAVALAQQMAADSACSTVGTDGNMNPPYFDVLYARRDTIGDVTLRVDGRLVTEVRSGINRTQLAKFLCFPLVVGGQGSRPDDDVRCTDMPGSPSEE
ncbi:hypothetical protein ACP70R_042179 [Stipagrostis hirtigluma subsp. patula]